MLPFLILLPRFLFNPEDVKEAVKDGEAVDESWVKFKTIDAPVEEEDDDDEKQRGHRMSPVPREQREHFKETILEEVWFDDDDDEDALEIWGNRRTHDLVDPWHRVQGINRAPPQPPQTTFFLGGDPRGNFLMVPTVLLFVPSLPSFLSWSLWSLSWTSTPCSSGWSSCFDDARRSVGRILLRNPDSFNASISSIPCTRNLMNERRGCYRELLQENIEKVQEYSPQCKILWRRHRELLSLLPPSLDFAAHNEMIHLRTDLFPRREWSFDPGLLWISIGPNAYFTIPGKFRWMKQSENDSR